MELRPYRPRRQSVSRRLLHHGPHRASLPGKPSRHPSVSRRPSVSRHRPVIQSVTHEAGRTNQVNVADNKSYVHSGEGNCLIASNADRRRICKLAPLLPPLLPTFPRLGGDDERSIRATASHEPFLHATKNSPIVNLFHESLGQDTRAAVEKLTTASTTSSQLSRNSSPRSWLDPLDQGRSCRPRSSLCSSEREACTAPPCRRRTSIRFRDCTNSCQVPGGSKRLHTPPRSSRSYPRPRHYPVFP